MQNLRLLFEIGLGKYLVGLFFCLTENNSTSMSSTIEVDDISDNGVSVVIGAVESQVLDCLGCPDFGVLDEINDLTVWRQIFL